MEKKIVLKDGAVISTDSEITFFACFLSFKLNKDNALIEHLLNLALIDKCDIAELSNHYYVIIKKDQVKEFKINN